MSHWIERYVDVDSGTWRDRVHLWHGWSCATDGRAVVMLADGGTAFREAAWAKTHDVRLEGRFSPYLRATPQNPIECDLCVLVLPCGRSAHLELGYAVGAGKVTIVLIPDAQERVLGHTMDCRPCATCGDLDGCHMPAKLRNALEPELMYKMCNHIVTSVGGLVDLISFLVTGMGSSEAEQPHATTA